MGCRIAASRYLLPMEMYMGLTSIAFGFSGGIMKGYLWSVLAGRGENLAWMTVLCVVGLMQFTMAAVEWFLGRHWSVWSPATFRLTVHRSVFVRAVCSFLSVAMWVYVVSTLAASDGTRSVGALWFVSPSSIIFSAWAFYENQKVYCAIDPHYDTAATLSFRR